MEENAIKKLQQYAADTNKEIQVQTDQGQVIIIKGGDNLFFIACDRELNTGFRSFFSGVFTTASEPCPSRMNIVKKGFLDHLSFRIGYQVVKIGAPAFDKKYKVTSNNPPMAYRLLGSPQGQKAVDAALELSPGMTVSINEIVTEVVPEIKDHAQLSVYLFKEWLTDGHQIDKLFAATAKLKLAFYPEA